MATAAAAGLAALALARPGAALRLTRRDAHTLAAAAAGTFAVLVGFAPKLLWETFNGDGAHAYESARMLLHRTLPFWGPDAGAMASYPGVTSFLSSYPTAWFIRLFGEIEASARIPYLLFLAAGLFAGLVAVIEARTEDRGPRTEGEANSAGVRTAWLLWPALIVLTAVLGFSATYNPYHADLALPATQDALVLAWFLGFAWAFLTRRHAWMLLFAGLTYATSPAGQLLLGFWLVAAALFQRPFPVRTLAVAAGAVALWVVVAKLSPAVLTALGQTAPGTEHATGSLARRLLNVQWRHWRRLAWAVVPGGILPALAVPLFWRQDRTARTIAATAAASFAFFYVQGRVSLHYFVPAMVLPLAVFWRMVPAAFPTRRLAPVVAGAALLALVASLPRHTDPHLAARAVGARIEDRLPGYDVAAPAALRRSELLSTLFPRDAHHTVPDSSYGGSPLSWYYYAHRAPATRRVAYVLASDSLPPAGTLRVASAHGIGLFLADPAALAQDRALRPASGIARLYRIDKRTLFRGN
jgi:hypothetical protein